MLMFGVYSVEKWPACCQSILCWFAVKSADHPKKLQYIIRHGIRTPKRILRGGESSEIFHRVERAWRVERPFTARRKAPRAELDGLLPADKTGPPYLRHSLNSPAASRKAWTRFSGIGEHS